MLHTAESKFSNFVIKYLSEIETEANSHILKPVYQGTGLVRIMEKMEVENHVTRSL